MTRLVNWLAGLVRGRAYDRCCSDARIFALNRGLNVGGGSGSRWAGFDVADAQAGCGDFNTKPLPFADGSYDFVVCEQTIEHVHNTTFFLSELWRVLQPGGTLLLSTECLDSLPNIAALILGRAPFSTQPMCGQYRGGWKKGGTLPDGYEGRWNDPEYSGVMGHVRVMATRQLREILASGFDVFFQKRYGLGHYILIGAWKKPLDAITTP